MLAEKETDHTLARCTCLEVRAVSTDVDHCARDVRSQHMRQVMAGNRRVPVAWVYGAGHHLNQYLARLRQVGPIRLTQVCSAIQTSVLPHGK